MMHFGQSCIWKPKQREFDSHFTYFLHIIHKLGLHIFVSSFKVDSCVKMVKILIGIYLRYKCRKIRKMQKKKIQQS